MMLEIHVSGLPVDDARQLVGIVSESDFLRRARSAPGAGGRLAAIPHRPGPRAGFYP